MKKIIFGILAIVGVAFAGIAYANPSQTGVFVQTSTATSSFAYLTLNATSTLTYDASATVAGGQALLANRASFLLQSTASSTSSVLTVRFQYSRDGSDWYDDSINLATTTSAVSIASTRSYVFGANDTNRAGRIIVIDTPTRYVRALVTSTTATSSIYAEIVPIREKSE